MKAFRFTFFVCCASNFSFSSNCSICRNNFANALYRISIGPNFAPLFFSTIPSFPNSVLYFPPFFFASSSFFCFFFCANVIPGFLSALIFFTFSFNCLLFGWFGLFVLVFFVLDSSPIVDVCFVAEDVSACLCCVLFFGGSNLSLLRLFVRRRKESIFDIFDIFVVCEFSFFCPSSQQKQL